MTFWDFCHAHTGLVVFGGLSGLVVAVLVFLAVEDAFITWHNVERVRASKQRPAERREGGER